MVDTGETMKKETPSKKKDIQGSNQNVNLPSKDVDVFAGNEKSSIKRPTCLCCNMSMPHNHIYEYPLHIIRTVIKTSCHTISPKNAYGIFLQGMLTNA